MARFSNNRRLVQAIIEGVAEMHRLHAAEGQYDDHDLIRWLSDHKKSELDGLYGLYFDCADPEMTADQQIGRFLHTLGQVKVGDRRSQRRATPDGGEADRNGECTISVWEASPRAIEALDAAREEWLGEGDQGGPPPLQGAPGSAADWIKRFSGSFKDDPDFEKVLEYGREYRQRDRPRENEE